MTRLCTVEGCGRKHKARGLCDGHYSQWWYRNEPNHRQPSTLPPHSSPAECDRWVVHPGVRNGCPHFTVEHWRALAVAGQLPPMALALGLHSQ